MSQTLDNIEKAPPDKALVSRRAALQGGGVLALAAILGIGPVTSALAAPGPWGPPYSNGQIPLSAMTPIPWKPSEYLKPSATAALINLNRKYRERFGSDILITDGYRTYAQQVALYQQKPHLAAVPGTSNHGWGLALDLGGGINSFGTAQHNWMRTSAPAFGWANPPWAQAGGSKPEPWHWEFQDGNYNNGGFLMALTDAQQQQIYDALLGPNGTAHMQGMMPFGQNVPTSIAESRSALQTLLDRTAPVQRVPSPVELRQEIADTKTMLLEIKAHLGI